MIFALIFLDTIRAVFGHNWIIVVAVDWTCIDFALHLTVISTDVHVDYTIFDQLFLFNRICHFWWVFYFTLFWTLPFVDVSIPLRSHITFIWANFLYELGLVPLVKSKGFLNTVFTLLIKFQNIFQFLFLFLLILQNAIEHLKIRNSILKTWVPSPHQSPFFKTFNLTYTAVCQEIK